MLTTLTFVSVAFGEFMAPEGDFGRGDAITSLNPGHEGADEYARGSATEAEGARPTRGRPLDAELRYMRSELARMASRDERAAMGRTREARGKPSNIPVDFNICSEEARGQGIGEKNASCQYLCRGGAWVCTAGTATGLVAGGAAIEIFTAFTSTIIVPAMVALGSAAAAEGCTLVFDDTCKKGCNSHVRGFLTVNTDIMLCPPLMSLEYCMENNKASAYTVKKVKDCWGCSTRHTLKGTNAEENLPDVENEVLGFEWYDMNGAKGKPKAGRKWFCPGDKTTKQSIDQLEADVAEIKADVAEIKQNLESFVGAVAAPQLEAIDFSDANF